MRGRRRRYDLGMLLEGEAAPFFVLLFAPILVARVLQSLAFSFPSFLLPLALLGVRVDNSKGLESPRKEHATPPEGGTSWGDSSSCASSSSGWGRGIPPQPLLLPAAPFPPPPSPPQSPPPLRPPRPRDEGSSAFLNRSRSARWNVHTSPHHFPSCPCPSGRSISLSLPLCSLFSPSSEIYFLIFLLVPFIALPLWANVGWKMNS